ncbi:uncharacterized protein LOC111369679 isoform X1 [Olea europaea var. sylvestris]|uniref:uncharacterized protein LOC111369679 isoform X1 n=1 Tax=Olea europaea var. sylvestris TaxID=158386 RepID=UPI000C1D2837|nr:uncharacterized protein LOC111369679 isoform X1 [Olea europaea var. sylvestris]
MVAEKASHGVDVNSCNFVGDDGLVEERLGVENEILVPKVVMKFGDETKVFEFYKRYAYQVGFPVRKRNTKRGDDRMVRYVSFTCSREGQQNSKKSTLHPPPTIETV